MLWPCFRAILECAPWSVKIRGTRNKSAGAAGGLNTLSGAYALKASALWLPFNICVRYVLLEDCVSFGGVLAVNQERVENLLET